MPSTDEPVPEHRGKDPSVLTRLLFAVVLAGLATGLVGSRLISNSAGAALRAEINQQNEGLARNLASRLDDRVRTRIFSLQANATRRGLEDLGPTTQSELNVLSKIFPEIDLLTVYRADGSPVAASTPRGLIGAGEMVPRPELTQLVGNQSSFSALRKSVPSSIELAVPIQSPPGTVKGFLVAQLLIDEVASHLTELQFDPTLSAFLIDRTGAVLAHPLSDRVLDQNRFALPESVSGGGSFSAEQDSINYLFATAPTLIVPAQVVVQQKESDALASVRDATASLISILLAVVVATVIVVGLIGRQILKPLRPMAQAARRIGRGEFGARVPERGSGEVGRLGVEFNRMAGALEQQIAEIKDRQVAEMKLRDETQLAETLHRVGTVLTSQLDLEQVVQAVTDIATELTGAQFGAFFYNVEDAEGESYTLYTIAGVPKEAFAAFPMPRNTHIFGPTFRGEAPVRSDDITKHPAYGQNPPYAGMPEGHLPVRSYLAVSVVSRTGKVVGGLFFGHANPAVFTERHERLMLGIAAHASIAIDNAQLFENQRSVAETLQRSLLPNKLPSVPGFQAAARYLPAQPGLEVGGDWYDVIGLEAGKVALAVGDVAGRGLRAAAIMGQLAHAMRAYAFEDSTPPAVLRRLNNYLCKTGETDLFATVAYAEVDLNSSTLRLSNAGHLPPLLIGHGGTAGYVDADAGLPVGVLEEEVYEQRTSVLPSDFTLLFFTDGLVEDRNMTLAEGMARLKACAEQSPRGVDALCDHVLAEMGEGRDLHDDIAVLAFGVGSRPPSDNPSDNGRR